MPMTLQKRTYAQGLHAAAQHLEAAAADYEQVCRQVEAALNAQVQRHGARALGIEVDRRRVEELKGKAGLLRSQAMQIRELAA